MHGALVRYQVAPGAWPGCGTRGTFWGPLLGPPHGLGGVNLGSRCWVREPRSPQRSLGAGIWLMRHLTLEGFVLTFPKEKSLTFFLSHDGIFLSEPTYQNRDKSPATGSQNICFAPSDALRAPSRRCLPPAPRCCFFSPISLSVPSWSLWFLVLVARGPWVLLATVPCHLAGVVHLHG